MTSYAFLMQLLSRGITLTIRDGELIAAPAIWLNDDDHFSIWRHRRALVALIRLRETAATLQHPDAPVHPCVKVLRQLWQEAEKASGQRLTFDGRLAKPRRQADYQDDQDLRRAA
jgi:hypothetical protein